MVLTSATIDCNIAAHPKGSRALNDSASFDILLSRVAHQRDAEAFRGLFDHYAPRVKSYLMRLGTPSTQAEDLAQDVLQTVWAQARQFDPLKASASTWIFTIARNKRIDLLRRERRAVFDPSDPAYVPDPEESADDIVFGTQQAGHIQNALQSLPEQQRRVILAAFFEDKPHSVIAETLGLPLGTIKSRMRLALGKLRKNLEGAAQ
jgi:RNA polymerase sigma factor (sigma-70 family)